MVLPIIIPLLSKAKRGLSIASSIITETYLSIGDSFSDSVFKDLKRSSVKPWGARTSENGDKTLSGGRINWSHSRSDWKQVIYSHGQNTTNGYLISPICKGNHFERAKTTLKMLLASWFYKRGVISKTSRETFFFISKIIHLHCNHSYFKGLLLVHFFLLYPWFFRTLL